MISFRDPDTFLSGGSTSFLTRSGTAKFSYGYSSFKGKRLSMEDFYETRISEVDGQLVAFFGVFDVEAFKQTDDDYLNEEKGQKKYIGSTASTAVLLGDRLLVANVGDSRVVACRAGSDVPLSTDHKPDRSNERQRIEEAGGFIIWASTWRVGGILAVSRAFGDKLLKSYVVADLEIQDVTDAEAAARKLIKEGHARGSSGNITYVVVWFGSSRTCRGCNLSANDHVSVLFIRKSNSKTSSLQVLETINWKRSQKIAVSMDFSSIWILF